jgi:hypothetical protein
MRSIRTLAVALGFCALLSGAAHAQASRTWVSGVGDDANPCSRTAPCKTFAGAISKTAAGGEISVLDPGGFGGVTITKSISIVAEDSGEGGILAAGVNGVIVNAGVNDIVHLRGLVIEGFGTGLNGVRFLAGAALHIEDCVIRGFRSGSAGSGHGVNFAPSGTSELFITDSVISDNGTGTNGGGILVKPTATGNAKVVLDGVQAVNSVFGVRADGTLGGQVTVTANDTTVFGNSFAGFSAVGNPGVVNLMLNGCTASSNGAQGVKSEGSLATVRLGNCTVTGNAVGIESVLSGVLATYQTNQINGNTNDGVANQLLNPN